MKNTTVLSLVIVGALIIAAGLIYTISNTKNQMPSQLNQNPNPVPGGDLNAKQDVVIQNFAFSPQTVTIKAGMYVIWTNQDSASHTVISDSGNEISSPSLSTGQTYAHQFTQPGTYTYHCSIHPNMKGTIVVQ